MQVWNIKVYMFATIRFLTWVEEISQQGNEPTYQLINQTISLLSPTAAYCFTSIHISHLPLTGGFLLK